MDAGAIFDFPGDIGDRRKKEMMETILQRKSVLLASGQQVGKEQVVIKEKEIIREIVKVRCKYCGRLYDETENQCPHCRAGR